jgi:uncharacterized DUF497 family protein
MDFQFDPAKAAGNLRKHGVSFADAEGVFMDSRCIGLIRMQKANSGLWQSVQEPPDSC